MQTFQYKAISKDGAKVTGVVEAFDEYAAVAKIKETCTVVTKIAEVRGRKRGQAISAMGKINEKALAVMCSQFSIILGAGLPIVRAVELIAAQTSDPALKRILNQAAGDVATGFSLSQSFASKGRGLPTTLIETVRSGEESGTLDLSFRRLYTYYDRQSKVKGKVKAAMAYPVFTMCVAVVAVAVIMVVAVPAFTASFSSMEIKLPGVTRALIAVSGFFVRYWALLAAALTGGWIGWQVYGHTERGGLWQARQRLRVPVLGKISLMKASSQFANTMSTLLAAGLPMIRAVSVTSRILDNGWIGSRLSEQLPRLEEGKSLGSCLRASGVLPDLLVEMAGVGEETGALESTLDVIGDYYDNEAELSSKKALSLMEPIVICLLAGVVIFILLSVYLPIFSLYGSIR